MSALGLWRRESLLCVCTVCMLWWNWAPGTFSSVWLQACVLDYWTSAGEQTAEPRVRGREEDLNV